MNLLEVLINPQGEEMELGERALVCSAANVLQIGEFQLLQLAYADWFGRDLPEALVDRLFASYMLRNEVPHWARHFAREILDRDAVGDLDPDQPAWHRFDHTFTPAAPPTRMRVILVTAGIVAMTMIGVTAATTVFNTTATSVFPPFFERDQLPPDHVPASQPSHAGQ